MLRGIILALAVVVCAAAPAGAEPAGAAPAGALPAGGSLAPADIVRDIAPSGRLRAAINYGNVVLAQKSASGEFTGVSVDLARELARRLDLPLDLVPFDAAGKVTASAGQDIWDVAFLAVDPVRANEITFTAPYVLIEGTYLVADKSPVRAIAEVDRDGAQISVGRGSAYDLYLTRAIRHASLVRTTTSADAVQLFVDQKLDAVAGVKQPLVLFASQNPGYRVIEGRFMAIEQAMGLPRGREAAAGYVSAFVEEMKRSGFVGEALARHSQPDAIVAPPASPTGG